jgi:phage-related minor tail protein
VASAAAKAYTAVQWLLNTALSANPIGLVVIALAALAAGLVLAYKHSETFRNIVDGAMGKVKGAVQEVDIAFGKLKDEAFRAWDWITDHWKLALFAFGPIGAAVYVISENFERIKTWATTAYDYITKWWSVANFAFGPIATAVGAIADAFKRVWRWANKAFQLIGDLIEKLGKVKIPHINLPGPLMVAPAASPGALHAGAYGAAGGSRSAGGAPITVNVYGAVDPEGTARAVRRILERHDRRQGRVI